MPILIPVRVPASRRWPQVEQGEGGCLGAAANSELGEDVADVVAGRLGADEQPLGDLGVGESLGDEPEDLLLPLAQLVHSPRAGAAADPELAQESGRPI